MATSGEKNLHRCLAEIFQTIKICLGAVNAAVTAGSRLQSLQYLGSICLVAVIHTALMSAGFRTVSPSSGHMNMNIRTLTFNPFSLGSDHLK